MTLHAYHTLYELVAWVFTRSPKYHLLGVLGQLSTRNSDFLAGKKSTKTPSKRKGEGKRDINSHQKSNVMSQIKIILMLSTTPLRIRNWTENDFGSLAVL